MSMYLIFALVLCVCCTWIFGSKWFWFKRIGVDFLYHPVTIMIRITLTQTYQASYWGTRNRQEKTEHFLWRQAGAWDYLG